MLCRNIHRLLKRRIQTAFISLVKKIHSSPRIDEFKFKKRSTKQQSTLAQNVHNSPSSIKRNTPIDVVIHSSPRRRLLPLAPATDSRRLGTTAREDRLEVSSVIDVEQGRSPTIATTTCTWRVTLRAIDCGSSRSEVHSTKALI